MMAGQKNERMILKMKTIITVNGKKVSRKMAEEKFGKETVARRIKEAKEVFMEDPLVLSEWMDGMNIKFQ